MAIMLSPSTMLLRYPFSNVTVDVVDDVVRDFHTVDPVTTPSAHFLAPEIIEHLK
jgi:hypothetical protein